MFDTNLVVVGNVLAAPEWRRFEEPGSVVANFRIASTARRFDRESNQWVDGNSLRVRVTAWRRLAEGVISSISVGDPVIVYGRLYTRDWKDDNGNNRISYEIEASSIGHDLARGQSAFTRTSSAVLPGVGIVDDSGEEPFAALPDSFGDNAPERDSAPDRDGAPERDSASEREGAPELEAPTPVEDPSGSPSDEEIALEVERLTADQPAPARRPRRPRKEPVAA